MPLEHPPKRSGWPPTLQRLKVAALVAARGIWISITVRVATAGVLVISTPSLQARAQEVPNQALLSELLRVYQNRVEQMNPIWVKYKSSHIETAEFRALLRQKNPTDIRWTETREFARKGAKTRVWADKRHPGASSPSVEDFDIFNAEVRIRPSNLENTYMLSRVPGPNFATPTEYTQEDRLWLTLDKWSKDKTLITHSSVTTSLIDDERVMSLELFYPSKWRSIYRLVSDHDYTIASFEEYNDRNQLAIKSGATYENYKGIFYPKQGYQDAYDRGTLVTKMSFVVDSIETRPSCIPDTLFTFAFPKDASIWDDDNKIMVRNTEVTESHLKEVIARLNPRTNLWLAWLNVAALGIAGALLTLIGTYFLRRKRRIQVS